MSFCMRCTLNAANTSLFRRMAVRKSSSGSTVPDSSSPFRAASFIRSQISLNRFISMSVIGWKFLPYMFRKARRNTSPENSKPEETSPSFAS